MRAEHPTPQTLQRYFDTDLAGVELAEVRSHVADCEACTSQLTALKRLGEFVVMAVDDMVHDARDAQPVDFDAMFEKIERGIATAAQPVANNAPVTNLASARERRFKLTQRLSNAGPALGALALAAAVLLMVYRPDPSQNTGNEEPYEVTASDAHSEIVQVDFGSNAGTVFDISLSDGSSNPVVWIDDDGEQDEPEPESGE